MAYRYNPGVVLSQIPNVIRWPQSKADAAGSNTAQVSGLDCAVAADMVEGLRAEVEHLRAENAAMRPMVEAVARYSPLTETPSDLALCPLCSKWIVWHGINHDAEPHAPHCPVRKAKAFIADHPAGEAS